MRGIKAKNCIEQDRKGEKADRCIFTFMILFDYAKYYYQDT